MSSQQRIATTADLYQAIRRAQEEHPNCDVGTMVVIDLPDGGSRTVGAVTYEEDLAGALVITAGAWLAGEDDPASAAGVLADDLARAVAAALAAGLTAEQVAVTFDDVLDVAAS